MPVAQRSSLGGGGGATATAAGGRMVLGGGGGPGVGVGTEDAVVMQLAAGHGDDSVITVNCPDEAGLGCDLCHTILEFGLRITRGDVSTDGQWCYVIFWVVPRSPSINIRWGSLKNRLMSMCPSLYAIPFYPDITQPRPPRYYLLKLLSADQKGLLHNVTRILLELELIIHRVKVSTTPDRRVVDLFFITDGTELLHTKERQEETCSMLVATLDTKKQDEAASSNSRKRQSRNETPGGKEKAMLESSATSSSKESSMKEEICLGDRLGSHPE